jgi:hypothetical protein
MICAADPGHELMIRFFQKRSGFGAWPCTAVLQRKQFESISFKGLIIYYRYGNTVQRLLGEHMAVGFASVC